MRDLLEVLDHAVQRAANDRGHCAVILRAVVLDRCSGSVQVCHEWLARECGCQRSLEWFHEASQVSGLQRGVRGELWVAAKGRYLLGEIFQVFGGSSLPSWVLRLG